MYDQNNIFAKILRGDLPCSKVFESESILAFNDINPKAKTHVLVIPKGEFINFEDFALNSTALEVGNFFKTVNDIAINVLKLSGNFKILTNNGKPAGQEVAHFHVHVVSNI